MQQERQQQRFGGLRVALAADAGSHAAECTAVHEALEELGAVPVVLAPQRGQVGGAAALQAQSTLELADAQDLDALVVPGGTTQLMQNTALRTLLQDMSRLGKPLALSGNGVGLLLATDLAPSLAQGRRLTGPAALAQEADAAGAHWTDAPAVADGMLVTGRGTDDLPAFVELLLDTLALHRQQGQVEPGNDIISATGGDG